MLKLCDYNVLNDPACTKSYLNCAPDDFKYYDKDGFELNQAEINFYTQMGYQLNNCLNHQCFQQNWFTLEHNSLYLDHSLILHRCSYKDDAYIQLSDLRKKIPAASLLMNTNAKWGFDFALDAVDHENNLYEVIHIECDYTSYSEFVFELNKVESKLKSIDWINAAESINKNKNKWTYLKGFEQNHWKAKFLLGWDKAEYTEKVV